MKPPYQTRVIDERRELEDKISRLTPFIGTGAFNRLPEEEQARLSAQLSLMEQYSNVLAARIANFAQDTAAIAEVISLSKVEAVMIAKTFRRDADALLQRMKEHRKEMCQPSRPAGPDGKDVGWGDDQCEAIAQHVLSLRALEDVIMRQGMALKYIGTPNPYPQSKNPESPVVAPTADGLRM